MASTPPTFTVKLTNDTGSSSTDTVTKDPSITVTNAPQFTGTTTYSVDNGPALSTYVAPTGQGNHAVVVTETQDGSAPTSHTLTFTLDTIAPNSSISGVSNNSLPTGTYTSPDGTTHQIVDSYNGVTYNGATNSTSPLTISGTYETGSTLTLTDSVNGGTATTLTPTLNSSNGTWSYTTAANVAAGDHHYTITDTDAAGNVSTSSFEELVRRSTANNPALSAPTLLSVTDGHDGIGTDTLVASKGLVFSGHADAYAIVKVFISDPSGGSVQVAQTVQADVNGNWSAAEDPAYGTLTDGQHDFSVNVTDLAGNSRTSVPTTYTVDATAPTLTFPTVSFTDTSTNQGHTSNGAVTLSGTVSDAHHVDSVEVYATTDGSNTPTDLGTATIKSDGTWSLTTTLTGDGTKTFSAIATDEAGNTTTTNAASSFVLDTHAPTIGDASLTYTNTAVSSSSAEETNVPQVSVLSDVTDASSNIKSVTVYEDINGVQTKIADETLSNGHYTANFSLTDGTHTLYEVATDIAGNSSEHDSLGTITVDTVAPVATATQTYDEAVGTHAVGDAVTGLTNDADITVTVTATDTGGTGVNNVHIFDGNTDLGAATAGPNNTYTFLTDLDDGAHTLHAVVTDNVGNQTITSDLASFKLDTMAPDAPAVALTTDSGSSTADLYTNDDHVTITGTVGDTVSITADQNAPVTATIGSNGTVTFDPAFTTDGSHTISVTETDPAGNTSGSHSLDFTLDTNPPSVTLTIDPNATQQLNVENSSTTIDITFSETPKDASGNPLTITLDDFTTTGGSLTNLQPVNDGTGLHYTATLTDTTHSNEITDTVSFNAGTVFDQAGNGNDASSVSVHGDTIAPDAPTITDVDGAPGFYFLGNGDYSTPVVISGTAEANSTVNIYDQEQLDGRNYPAGDKYDATNGLGASNTIPIAQTTADASGHFSVTVYDLASDETHVLSATATDAADNASVTSQTVAAAVLSNSDTYSAASALNKGVIYQNPAITNASMYFVVGNASDNYYFYNGQNYYTGPSSDTINAGRANFEVINDEYSLNSTITVGSSIATIVHGGQGASITAGSGYNIFAIDALSYDNFFPTLNSLSPINEDISSASPSSNAQSISHFTSHDAIDISAILTQYSSIEIDVTKTGDVLTVHNDISGGDTVINISGTQITADQIITATTGTLLYGDSTTASQSGVAITTVGLDGTKTVALSMDAHDYSVAVSSGTGGIIAGGIYSDVSGASQINFADGFVSYSQTGAAAQVYRAYEAAYGSAASADALATGVAFLSSGHTVSQLETGYLATLSTNSLSNQQFVDQTYENALGRAADASGESFWTSYLASGNSRADMLTAFAQSGESQLHNYTTIDHGLWVQSAATAEVEGLYSAILGRDASTSDLSYGTYQLQSGTTEKALADQLLSTDEFHTALVNAEGGDSDADFVNYIYHSVLGRDADAGGSAYWQSVIADPTAGRSGFVTAILASAEDAQKGDSYSQAVANGANNITAPIHATELLLAVNGTGASDAAYAATVADLQHGATLTSEAQSLIAPLATLSNLQFVDSIYETALGRNADASGEAYWTSQLDHGLSRADFVVDTINSIEFQSHNSFHPTDTILV